jgi:hypothetical protein
LRVLFAATSSSYSFFYLRAPAIYYYFKICISHHFHFLHCPPCFCSLLSCHSTLTCYSPTNPVLETLMCSIIITLYCCLIISRCHPSSSFLLRMFRMKTNHSKFMDSRHNLGSPLLTPLKQMIKSAFHLYNYWYNL